MEEEQQKSTWQIDLCLKLGDASKAARKKVGYSINVLNVALTFLSHWMGRGRRVNVLVRCERNYMSHLLGVVSAFIQRNSWDAET